MTSKFTDIKPAAIQQLTQNFPFFFMIIYLIPFYYITSKIASEKESKSREGMKMMGLTDSTYYLSWFIVFLVICSITSVTVTIMTATGIFKNVDILLFFSYNMIYSLNLYGWAFCIVSFLPTKRSSGIAATLLHIISYYLCFTINDPSVPASTQYAMSILPNVCMNQLTKQIFFYNFQTEVGLNFSTGSVVYQNYSFRGGMLMLLFDCIFWGLLGLYLDQVVPSQFGIAKPWNFLCKSKKSGRGG